MSKSIICQVIAGIVAIIAVPLLYVGLMHNVSILAATGFLLFTASMLTTPILRLVTR
ncbi:hypothetical protein Q0601_07300 [Paracoccus onubensis]|uniref:hypothetical protein n=1 Tax=Paracoccus onubensis TaxID=1675788 RepID=UPI002731A5CE|nr:hypothetical protein [Paracoccus onubensis]MDP0926971.1 hypothetical protein [Paracoccus onubensis]